MENPSWASPSWQDAEQQAVALNHAASLCQGREVTSSRDNNWDVTPPNAMQIQA